MGLEVNGQINAKLGGSFTHLDHRLDKCCLVWWARWRIIVRTGSPFYL
jgi:hypothetical protein